MALVEYMDKSLKKEEKRKMDAQIITKAVLQFPKRRSGGVGMDKTYGIYNTMAKFQFGNQRA